MGRECEIERCKERYRDRERERESEQSLCAIISKLYIITKKFSLHNTEIVVMSQYLAWLALMIQFYLMIG